MDTTLQFQTIGQEQIAECVELYLSVFNCPPWNESWEAAGVAQRLLDCWKTPGFLGLIARSEGVAVGFALGYLEHWDKSRHYYLKEMCVVSEQQNRGVGTGLLEALEIALREQGCEKIYLHTARDTGAQAFYEKRGFYVSTKMIMMAKWLAPESARF